VIIEKKIEVFLAVADAGSFSGAARRLSLSQSAVSFHVDTLERELGTSLFRRKGRTISLTPEGELLHQEVRTLAQEARRVEDIFSEESASIAQRIRLAGGALTCAFTVPWDLAAFQQKYPEVVFTYERLRQDALVDKLVSGELDLAFVGYRIRHRKLATQVCLRDEIILVGAPDRAPDRVTLEELGGLPLLWVTNDRGLELLVSRSLSEAGLPMWKLNIVVEVEDLSTLKTAVQAGLGLAFLPRVTAAHQLRFEVLKEVSVEGLELNRLTYLVYSKGKHPREVVRRFVEFMRQRCAQKAVEAEARSTP